MNKNEKWLQYAVKISAQIQEMFQEDECNNPISLEELSEGENAKEFIHALANVVPTQVFNRLTNDNKNWLEFNHIANQIIVEKMIDVKVEEVTNLPKPE